VKNKQKSSYVTIVNEAHDTRIFFFTTDSSHLINDSRLSDGTQLKSFWSFNITRAIREILAALATLVIIIIIIKTAIQAMTNMVAIKTWQHKY
jgi:hypothetical protein